EVKPGMVLAKTIFTVNGKILLAQRMELTEPYIARLKAMGIPAVFITTGERADPNIPDLITDQVRVEAQYAVQQLFAGAGQNRRVSVALAKKAVNNVVDELLANRQVLVNVTDIRSSGSFVFGHSVSVAVFSIMTGICLEYNELQLRDLGVGALLHDLGKTMLEKGLADKHLNLTASEREKYREHPELGFELLRRQKDLSLLASHVAFQHHERVDGNGFPRRLADKEIHEYARIVAVADAYDLLTADRGEYRGLSTGEAVKQLLAQVDTHFDRDIVRAFISNIAIYPIGSMVKLSTGETGVVVDNHRSAPLSPVVLVLLDSNDEEPEPHREYDLSKDSSVVIVSQLS
ncbi:MAG TPA: HD-GYP domain-containing protein, partial [Bacillota bacterium]|nr:HD-GYP domain-containing protein [Bacillota bacterium]